MGSTQSAQESSRGGQCCVGTFDAKESSSKIEPSLLREQNRGFKGSYYYMWDREQNRGFKGSYTICGIGSRIEGFKAVITICGHDREQNRGFQGSYYYMWTRQGAESRV